MDDRYMKAPFPYFGGKSTVADEVWAALGDCKMYIEPFFGSGAVLLNRQDYDSGKHTEVVNDKDGFISNVWRAMKYSPDETAEYADWPINHADLNARRKHLISREKYLLENLQQDYRWHDPELAGLWIWAASCWIGSGLTRKTAIPELVNNCGINNQIGQVPELRDNRGINNNIGKIPDLINNGGINNKIGQIPRLTNGMGINNKIGQIPQLTWNNGINTKHNEVSRTEFIKAWFASLSNRLRHVKVVCGDWSRVCGGNWQDDKGICGMFFDPPYSAEAGRDKDLYHHESLDVAHDVREWALRRGDNPRYRIVIAGYSAEHSDLEAAGWTAHAWKANGGYANNSKENDNRHKETLWFSPHCININKQTALF